VFTGAIIKNKILTPHQAGQLVFFMMEHCDEVFTVPDDVEDIVRARVNLLARGQTMPRMGKAKKLVIGTQASRFNHMGRSWASGFGRPRAWSF